MASSFLQLVFVARFSKLIATSPAEAGRGTSSEQSCGECVGVPLQGNLTTARGTDGKTGSGMYSINNKCEVASPRVEELLATFRKDGTAQRVWEYFAADFKRITGIHDFAVSSPNDVLSNDFLNWNIDQFHVNILEPVSVDTEYILAWADFIFQAAAGTDSAAPIIKPAIKASDDRPKQKKEFPHRHCDSTRCQTINDKAMAGVLEIYLSRLHDFWMEHGIDTETLKTGSVGAIVSFLALYAGYLYIISLTEAPVTFNVPLPEELRADWNRTKWDDLKGKARRILEDQVQGKWNTERIVSYCPADGRILSTSIPLATRESVDKAVQDAKRAQVEWAQTTFAQRRRLLKTLLKYVLDHQDDIVTACCLDSGKTKVDASFGEILVTAEKLKWTIDHGEKALTPQNRPTNFLMMYKKNTVRYEPLGVVSACVSWNYPFHNLISPVISALFAGNAIVVKPSEQTAWCSSFFVDVIRAALVSCGHSPDLVQLVVCLPQVADSLTSHEDVSQLTFIGSRPVAHKVCESAAKSLIPVTVELGGKDPFVVLDDSTTVRGLESIASILMRGVFQSAGQNCIGVERVIALPGTYDKLIDIVTPRVKALTLGSILLDSKDESSPFTPDVGAMISPAGFARLETLIAEAVDQGARLIHGGKRYNHPKHSRGHYFTPTLLVDVTPSMRIAQVELFAPVMVIMRASSVSDAIEIANSTPYALGASVFGHNSRDVETCIRNIKAGMVAVNDFGAFYAVQLPFGGVKGSGYGRFAGEEGLRGVSNLKAVCVDRFPKIVGTQIPPRVDYPIYKGEGAKRNGTGAWEMCKGVVETGYALDIVGRVRGILRILTNS
ncbi:oxidoreductase (Msc7), putative [Talaromyces stipitatus ATCC 10500]|uniref:aldehyde dehydrogenase (NAD(+)) n=1 Tax=Talaromyces stipitatus (strain ATCC 10500 / CBS 375.48 / QM 6759 / NRRL 1006) TaxID=441959 RepID=B8M4P4_TALSN|nr:oxidoreductase (Msc7), putative [Talaromyces stipitatus ATCC 10500]EED19239.1 oxidoreductase (Msc7), putative [Talaromyces stipitatus ATCC 10500]